MFKYTVCFIKNNNDILMLNREKPPIMGVWNGVGGKLRKMNLLMKVHCVKYLRKTGIKVDNYFSKGTVIWKSPNGELDGIYVYLYEVNNNLKFETSKKTREGILDWKSIDWVLAPDNFGLRIKFLNTYQFF